MVAFVSSSTLEFTKAFALWCRDWIEEGWMAALRKKCQSQAKYLLDGADLILVFMKSADV
jgi:hypothetical protein